MTLNNLPVCHLGSGNNMKKKAARDLCGDAVQSTIVFLQKSLCSSGKGLYSEDIL